MWISAESTGAGNASEALSRLVRLQLQTTSLVRRVTSKPSVVTLAPMAGSGRSSVFEVDFAAGNLDVADAAACDEEVGQFEVAPHGGTGADGTWPYRR